MGSSVSSGKPGAVPAVDAGSAVDAASTADAPSPEALRAPAVPLDADGAPESEEGTDTSYAPPPDLAREGSLAWRLTGLIRTIRPHQWVKNVFVLAPVVFAKSIFDVQLLTNAGAAFLVFCLLAGAVYTMNDLADVEQDRLHPVKRFRPIASGRVSEAAARVLAISLVVVSLVAGWFVSPWFDLVAGLYFAQNIAYTKRLKHVAYVDVAMIALGFVLRVVGGGFATRVSVSWYLLATTALLALFLGFGKRRHELTAARGRARATRAALEGYSQRGLDRALASTGLATLGVYLVYTLDPQTRAFFQVDQLWPTTILVALGVARFLTLVRSRPHVESPTQEMLSDGPMVGIVLLWVGVILWFVYHLRPS
ncbi:MAG TPA: decaprenyl-phosphate phosphoribosyltransferase [Polyangiaceae bacterium]|nr:decaprenyl-phosphate phosphoribosyltransferase [Polyangiaceae bacterium]